MSVAKKTKLQHQKTSLSILKTENPKTSKNPETNTLELKKRPAFLGGYQCWQVAFLERVGIRKSTLARVVDTCPKLFHASLEGQWEPTLKYMELLGIKREEWGVMIAQQPAILILNFAKDILPKVWLTRLSSSSSSFFFFFNITILFSLFVPSISYFSVAIFRIS